MPADLAQRIATAQVLRYAGYTYDETSGLSYCSQRYYDPLTQAFISLDPAQADGQRSGYLYCAGDPVNSVDETGLYAHAFVPSKGEQTSYFTKVLKVNAGMAFTRRVACLFHPVVFLAWFYRMVKSRGPWDLKLTAKGNKKKSNKKKGNPVTERVCGFRGGNISMEDFGNINYGYVGAASGIPLAMLYAGSFYAAGSKGFDKNEKDDRNRIKRGFKLLHIKGMTIRPPWKIDSYIYPGYRTAEGF